ncbi:MAG: electron transfer flavoprotein subunit beta/FixA family protein [Fibrobacterota bacterium]
MKIAVLVKSVPDTASQIRVKDGTTVDESGLKFDMNPYDEYAVEEAVQTKNKISGSTLTAVSVGDKKADAVLRTAMALGADEITHIVDESGSSDSFRLAKIIAKYILDNGFDIVFCGKQAVDADNAQLPSMLAALLSWAHAGSVIEFETDGSKIKASSMVDGGKDIMEAALPAVVSATKGLNEPKYPSLPKKMKAKKAPVNTVALADLGAGEGDPLYLVTGLSNPPERPPARMIEGAPAEAAAEAVKLLAEEARVI